MTDAPKRIWLQHDDPYSEFHENTWCSEPTGETECETEYTRSDLIPAMLAEARAKGIRDAAAIVGVEVGHGGNVKNCQCGMCLARRRDHTAILALLDQPAGDRHE